ncbi:MAG: signal transduction histidine kinase [Deltaproteobacteria bacterium]|nr:signal transduction histidine kinase [Deltaproteobacteria bacterium]
MDTFTLAATSFTIALSLFITGKMDRLQKSFAVLCLAVFIFQAAAFLNGLLAAGFCNHLEHLGLLAGTIAVVFFFQMLTRNESFLTKGFLAVVSLLSTAGAVSQFTPLGTRPGFHSALIAYTCIVVGICYFSLLYHVNRLSPSTEKKRLGYLLIACPTAAFICSVDLSGYLGYHFAPVSGLVLSALLYFTLLIVAYPQLSELHHFFARAFVIAVSTLIGAAIIYLVSFFFSGSAPSFTSVFMMSFLIIISITPVRMMLKNMFNVLYPESKDVFTSLYEFDEKLEKEKALMLAEMAPVFAHEEVNRLNTVVSQFLDYARPAIVNRRPQDINALVLRTISIIAANRMAGNIAISNELQEGLPHVDMDEQQMLQVMINISLNAIEAMPRGGSLTYKTLKIETGDGPAVGISIQDTGSGIPPENLKNIFKPFYTTKKSGVGLGLAICRRIIREHGGSIRVKSIDGQGSIFLIQLGVRDKIRYNPS